MKKIPIGIDDFKKIISEDYYYIDKTNFIEEIIKDGAEVKFFTRPRRFGKTLNMSMLKYFFDIKEKNNNRELFKNLNIEKSPYFEYQGKYPVIFISMKDIKGNSFSDLFYNLKISISNLFEEYSYLRENLSERNKIIFDNIWYRKEDGVYSDSLKFLSNILESYYNEKVVILIDEYDMPLMSSYENGFYNEAVEFFKILYGSLLKTNTNLKMGVLTGAIRIAQAGIFSDLNNIEIHTVLNEEYEEYFGLLENEVEKALSCYEINDSITEVKSWYDGYKFGNTFIYNPWSILKYIKYKKLDAYWVNTSGNILIKNLLLMSDNTVFESLIRLVDGKENIVYINENISLGNNLSPNSLWELLLFSGYITISEKIDNYTYLVKIPNKEIQTFFKTLFVDIVFRGKNNIADMKYALYNKNIEQVINILEEVVINAMSFYDTDKKYENPYQTLISGFLYGLNNFYEMIPNVETGYGRADIILKPKMPNIAGYIFELKRAKKDSSENIETEAKKAFIQIEEKKYDSILKKAGIKDIVKIGLAFDGKKVKAYY